MLNNPVMRRELMGGLRTTRALALGLAFLWILGVLVILLWPEGGVYSLAASTGRTLFSVLSAGFIGLVSLCAPSFSATAISMEKERETWELLWDSLLRPGEIIFGKFSSGIGFALILILCSLPMMGVCSIGVSLRDVLMVYAIAVVAAFFFGMLGLFFSATCRNSYRALIFCYITIVGICGGVWVPSLLLGVWAESFHIIHFVRGLSPFAALTSVAYPARFASEHLVAAEGFGAFADSPYVFLLFGVAAGLALLALAWVAVARPPAKRFKKDELADTKRKKLGFPFYIFDPSRPRKMIGPLFNIIAVKEMRTKAFGRMTWFMRALAGCVIASFLLAFLPLTQLGGDVTTTDTIAMACIGVPLAIIVLLCPVLTAGAISEERESGIFDMLRVTRISAAKIIMGKLEVAWLFTLMLLIAAVPSYFMLVYLGSDSQDMEHIASGMTAISGGDFSGGYEALSKAKMDFLWKMLRAFGVMAVTMAFCTVSGLVASILCRKTSTATAVAYGIALLVSVGTLMPYALAGSIPPGLLEGILTFNPFAAAAKAVSQESFVLLPGNIWLHNIILLGALTLALLVFSILRVRTLLRPTR